MEAIGMIKKSLGINSTQRTSTSVSTHAEMAALMKFNRMKNKPEELDLVVLRYTPSGYLAESRPCKNCLIRLNKSSDKFKYRIVDCYYSTKDRTIAKEKFPLMLDSEKTHTSSGFSKSYRFCVDNKENIPRTIKPSYQKPKVQYVRKKSIKK